MIDTIFYLLFYLILFLDYYILFVLVSGRKEKWQYVIIYALLSMTLSYFVDHFSFILDPIYLLIFSYLTKKDLPLNKHLFYSFFVFTSVDLSVRLIEYIILPTLMQTTATVVRDNGWNILLAYALTIPVHFVMKFLLHIDYESIREASDNTKVNIFQNINLGMIAMFIFVQISTFVQYNIAAFPAIINNYYRYLVISIYVLIFLVGVNRLNTLASSILEEKLVTEQEHHFHNLANYNQYLEGLLKEINTFKEETSLSLRRLDQVVDTEDVDAISKEFDQQFQIGRNPFKEQRFNLDKLVNIHIPTLKSFLAAKIFEAQKQGIETKIEIPDNITALPMKLIDFIIIISIFCDNALEAAMESQAKEIKIAFFCHNDAIVFLIENSSKEERINISQIYKEGYSTKGHSRGIGLYNVMKLLQPYPFATLTTKSKDFQVSQRLEMVFNP